MGPMLRERDRTIPAVATALALSVLAVSACGSDADGGAADRPATNVDGAWELIEAQVDGEPVPGLAGRLLDITGTRFGAEGVCNDFGGDFGGEVEGTQEGCGGEDGRELDDLEARMIDTVRAGPSRDGELLAFEADGVRLVYGPVTVVAAEDVFSALVDPALQTDPSELYVDPEGGPPQVDRLARLDHPDETASFYVGTRGELVCFRWSSEGAGGGWCVPAREAARTAAATELVGPSGSLGARVALVPDAVAGDPELAALGVLENNVLVLDADTAPGEVTVAADGWPEFTLVIPG